ncbi:MAG: alpha-ribazole phosphatase [Paracoccaceae bacterium]|jgi:alpha-ribazole phosphatase
MSRVWWIRHGPTHAKTMVGWTDLAADLSDHAALARLSDALPDAPIISSDLDRAVMTANAIGGARARLEHQIALREMHFGDWENRTFDDIEKTHGPLIRKFWEEPGDIAAPGGESWNDLSARVSNAVDMLLSEAIQDLIVVAHMGVILTQVQRAYGWSAYETLAQKIDNLSVTRLDLHDGDWAPILVNHLP